jgi:DNA-binding transcriptional regulator YiaG
MEPMTPEEFQGICARLSLSRREFGRRFGTGPNQAQRYADGSVKIPGPTAILLRILDRLPELMSMVPEGAPKTTRRMKTKRKAETA